MNKQLSLLNGLAILGVVFSHAASWGQSAMYAWADHIRATLNPAYTSVGTLQYYILATTRQFAAFCVAAFLFASAWFIAYAVGHQPTVSWRVIRARLVTLLIPFLIWSTLTFIADYVRGMHYSAWDYLGLLLLTNSSNYFIPLLCYLYILSPLLIPWARAHGMTLLIVAGVIQLATMSLDYLALVGISSPLLDFLLTVTHNWAVPRWIFYYVFGLVSSLHVEAIKLWMIRVRWVMLALTVPLAALAVIENDLVFRATGRLWGYVPVYFVVSLYAVAVIITLLAFRIESLSIVKTLHWLGTRSYGIFLAHSRLMGLSAVAFQRFVPQITSQPLIFVLLQFLVGLGGSLLFMTVVSNSPARKYYRYLFG
jgi:peptidoglycan/LPS O-acetylase OafA/YrhL